MTQKINGTMFKNMVLSAAAAISNQREEINELNVFPVPDGDTGTNMSLTVGNAADELNKSNPGTVSRAAEITASAMLRGARGNSGVITSLLFRGIAKYLKDMESTDAKGFALALSAGVESAYKAVMKPAEGTILTVSRLASDAAVEKSHETEDIEDVLSEALRIGQIALADTVNLNPVLKKAGVIDAGGKGYLYMLEGMLRSLRGEPIVAIAGIQEIHDKADFSGFETKDIRFTYCTEFIVSRKFPKDPDLLRDFLDVRGDSIVVVEDVEIIKVHVHTNEPGAVLTEALTYGPLLTVKIENMHQQHTQKLVEARAEVQEQSSGIHALPEKKYGVVAVCNGEGLSEMFRQLEADVIVTGGQTMNPSTQNLEQAVNATPAETVFILPNNKNIILAAEQAKDLIKDKRVIVIPTTTVPQGLSAMLSLDQGAELDQIEEGMKGAAECVHTAFVTYAARDSVFDGITIKAGQYLVLLENTLLTCGSDFREVMMKTAARLKEFDPEFITLYTGHDATAEMSDTALTAMKGEIPDAECNAVSGGQSVYSVIIAAE